MTTDVQTTPEINITAEQLELIQKTIAVGATPTELNLFFYDCKRRGVHPLDRLIHFTKRGGKYTPITSIDFMRTRAHESGDCAGIDDAVFTMDGSTTGKLDSATVTVYRLVQGQRCAFVGTARWSEYCPGQGQDFMWQKMPHTMLGKCAEAIALRKGFPAQLAGLYESAELDQAGETAAKPMLKMPLKKAMSDSEITETVIGIDKAIRVGGSEPATEPEQQSESLSTRLQKALAGLVTLTGREPVDLIREFSSFNEKDKVTKKETGKIKYATSIDELAKRESWGHITLKRMETALEPPREAGSDDE